MDCKAAEDWAYWTQIGHEDPARFERERSAAIEELIMRLPAASRRRCRQLQWKIDAVRQVSPNSMAACVRIYDMLMDSVYGPGGLVQAAAIGMLSPSGTDCPPATDP